MIQWKNRNYVFVTVLLDLEIIIHASSILILSMLLAIYSSVQPNSEEIKKPIITENEFDLEQKILNASASEMMPLNSNRPHTSEKQPPTFTNFKHEDYSSQGIKNST